MKVHSYDHPCTTNEPAPQPIPVPNPKSRYMLVLQKPYRKTLRPTTRSAPLALAVQVRQRAWPSANTPDDLCNLHPITMIMRHILRPWGVNSNSNSVLDFVPPPPPPPPPRSGSPTHSAGGSKSRRRSALLEPRRLAFGGGDNSNGDGTSYNNHDGGCINPVSPPLINHAPASDAPVTHPRHSVSLEPRRSPAAVINHHTAAPPLPSVPIAPQYAVVPLIIDKRKEYY